MLSKEVRILLQLHLPANIVALNAGVLSRNWAVPRNTVCHFGIGQLPLSAHYYMAGSDKKMPYAFGGLVFF